MFYKELLPRVACFTFTFMSGLIFMPSFCFAEESFCSTELNEEDKCLLEDEYHAVILNNNSKVISSCCLNPSINEECDTRHHLPSVLRDFSFRNVTCVVDMKNHFFCTWNTVNLPKNAVYSADAFQQNVQHLHCSHIVEKEVVECHGLIVVKPSDSEFRMKVNISLPTFSCCIAKTFDSHNIVKLDPPKLLMSSNITTLKINWTLSEYRRISENLGCFKFELKINDEVLVVPDDQWWYIKQDVDVMKMYSVQIRVKLSQFCGEAIYWSDWSDVNEVGPFESEYSVNPWLILVIAFVLPMLLLAILLICKCQRLPKKLFPPIPGPSLNVKNLLEKDNHIQDLWSRYVHHETEVVHTVEERNAIS